MNFKFKLVLALSAAIPLTCCGDVDKWHPVFDTPVEKAVKTLPKVAPAQLEAGNDHHALQKHLLRIERAPDAKAEAAEVEALVAWLKKNKVADFFVVSLGHRCPKLTDEELLTLSSWPTCTLMLAGGVRAPVIVHSEVTFKDSQNLLRLIPLATATEGGHPK